MTRSDGAPRRDGEETLREGWSGTRARSQRRTPPAEAFHRIVAEAIDAVAEPAEARAILADALTSAGLPSLPVRPESLALFASVYLRSAIERRLGDLMANSVEAEIALLLERAVSARREEIPRQDTGVRARRGHDETRLPAHGTGELDRPDRAVTPQVVEQHARLVLVATADRRAAAEFRWFDDDVTNVVIVSDAYACLAALSARGERVPTVVLDGAAPTIAASMLAMPELDAKDALRVVLWRYEPVVVAGLRGLSAHAARWQEIRRGARACDVLAFVASTR